MTPNLARFAQAAGPAAVPTMAMPPADPVAVRRIVLGALAAKGRGGDRVIGHLTPGEIVIPKSAQTPEVMKALRAALGEDLGRFTVGGGDDHINPHTGAPEYEASDGSDTGGNDPGAEGSGGPADGVGGDGPDAGDPGGSGESDAGGFGEGPGGVGGVAGIAGISEGLGGFGQGPGGIGGVAGIAGISGNIGGFGQGPGGIGGVAGTSPANAGPDNPGPGVTSDPSVAGPDALSQALGVLSAMGLVTPVPTTIPTAVLRGLDYFGVKVDPGQDYGPAMGIGTPSAVNGAPSTPSGASTPAPVDGIDPRRPAPEANLEAFRRLLNMSYRPYPGDPNTYGLVPQTHRFFA